MLCERVASRHLFVILDSCFAGKLPGFVEDCNGGMSHDPRAKRTQVRRSSVTKCGAKFLLVGDFYHYFHFALVNAENEQNLCVVVV